MTQKALFRPPTYPLTRFCAAGRSPALSAIFPACEGGPIALWASGSWVPLTRAGEGACLGVCMGEIGGDGCV